MADQEPPHILNFRSNRDEILRLTEIHARIAGAGPGYKSNVAVLNKSAVVLLVACWEAFVEDLAKAAFDFMLARASSPDLFPATVLARSSESLRTADDRREVWRLAGDGWKLVLQDHRADTLDRYVGKLNTPRPRQVDEMFEVLIGLKSLSSKWSWPGMKNSTAVSRLERLVTLRGEIAHRVATSRSVHKDFVIQHTEFISRICAISSNQVRSYIDKLLNVHPWLGYRYGKTA